ncbi:unnamed protein product [Echinostoma caproni]|uniref:Reverse transcriptase domain-containing protein n=1 Tax=Echinostoma caproni TaxID=27848 RepID=A0A183B3G4_9TREM|nr:unnamed protein product [Echinostoma caproni]
MLSCNGSRSSDLHSSLKGEKEPRPNELPPTHFKMWDDHLVTSITTILRNIWTQERIPSSLGKSPFVPIFKKGISLMFTITKVLAPVIHRHLTPLTETKIREQQAGFLPGRGRIDQMFTLRQIPELCHTGRVLLDLKRALEQLAVKR